MGTNGAEKPSPENLTALRKLFEEGKVSGFHVKNFPAGHGPTNFSRWVTSDEPYEVAYKHGFEPYVVMRKDQVPKYDERFRGYGMNKIIHLLGVSKTSTFHVLPETWVMELPHERSRDWVRTQQTKHSENDRFVEVQALFE